MNRYKNTRIVDSKYTETLYPEIEDKETDIYIYAKYGDRLDTLAYKYYNDTSLWWIIARANDFPGDSLFVELPNRLRIPTDIASILNKINKR